MTNSKQTKRALLSSVVALVLCFTMLLGTTYAWFTDTASTGINRIVSGTLDMEVYHSVGKTDDGESEWELIDGATNLFCNVEGKPILWEPGASATETFKIVNAGNLAFKYLFSLNYANATKTEDGHTLAEVLSCGIEGYAADLAGGLEDIVTYNNLLSGEDITLTVWIRWEPTNHDNDYNVEGGLSIDLGVNVFATQYTHEYDSTGNEYDKDAEYAVEVKTIDELRQAITNSDGSVPIVLAEDIILENEDELIVAAGSGNNVAKAILNVRSDIIIDLNGHKLKYTGNNATFGIYVGSGATLTIIDSSSDNGGSVITSDSTAWAIQVGNGTANIYGGYYSTANDCCVYANNGKINVYGGKFECNGSDQLTLNIGNKYRGEGRGIYVYGGTFKNFEPGVNNAQEVFLADGYKVESTVNGNDTWYTVVPVTETTVTTDTTFDMAGQTIALKDVKEPYVMTSDNSGAKITLKNATYTGEAQGIYFGKYTGSNGTYNFNTLADNVTVQNLKVSTNITSGNNKISAGVWVYGSFELNNCKMSGTTTVTECTPYDVIFVNHSKGTVNGGEYDSMFVYTHSEVALNGVKVGKIACMTNTKVGKALTIDKDCEIGTIEFVGSDDYVMNIVVADGAQIGSIVYKNNTYTVAEWNAYVASL